MRSKTADQQEAKSQLPTYTKKRDGRLRQLLAFHRRWRAIRSSKIRRSRRIRASPHHRRPCGQGYFCSGSLGRRNKSTRATALVKSYSKPPVAATRRTQGTEATGKKDAVEEDHQLDQTPRGPIFRRVQQHNLQSSHPKRPQEARKMFATRRWRAKA